MLLWTKVAEDLKNEAPGPSTKRKSGGWTSEVTIRIRSLAKRISSRRQTTLTARRALSRTSAPGLLAGGDAAGLGGSQVRGEGELGDLGG